MSFKVLVLHCRIDSLFYTCYIRSNLTQTLNDPLWRMWRMIKRRLISSQFFWCILCPLKSPSYVEEWFDFWYMLYKVQFEKASAQWSSVEDALLIDTGNLQEYDYWRSKIWDYCSMISLYWLEFRLKSG